MVETVSQERCSATQERFFRQSNNLNELLRMRVIKFTIFKVIFIHRSMSTSPPTRGQLERTLSQRIQALYREQLGHQPGKVKCCLVEQQVMIVIEDAITQPEQALVSLGKEELVEQVRFNLHQVLQEQIKELIESVIEIKVMDILCDATLETARTGTIVILESVPQFRENSTGTKRRKPAPIG